MTTTTTDKTPERQVADIWMANKGFPDARPVATRSPEPNVWTFTYNLPDGQLVLEVVWYRKGDGEWAWDVGTQDFVR